MSEVVFSKQLFILIDQSITEPGGHHYEYAQRILDAAKEEGFETLLLANKKYKGRIDHDVLPVFSRTFWDNYNYYLGSYIGRQSPFQSYFNSLQSHVDLLLMHTKRRVVFSKFGLALARARNLEVKNILLKSHLEEDSSTIPTSRSLLFSAKTLLSLSQFAKRVSPAILKVGGVVKIVLLAPIGAVAAVASLLIRLIHKRAESVFVSELVKAHKSHLSDERDYIVFIPNATTAEIQGLGNLLNEGHHLSQNDWAFLFRRPLFQGYPNQYKIQKESTRTIRTEFARLKHADLENRASLYTDTDELSDQYNYLQLFSFHTLPVPAGSYQEPEEKGSNDLTLGYLGDARDEKGFQHLLPLVSHFTDNDADWDRKIRFLFQANYNTVEGEPDSRFARGILENLNADNVELTYGPFDSDEYADLMRRTDIVLVPYAQYNYLARSSNVFVEAVIGRKPILVPSCTWMAGLSEPYRRRHFISLFKNRKPTTEFEGDLEDLNNIVLSIDDTENYVYFFLNFEGSFDGYVTLALSSINKYNVMLEHSRQSFKCIDGEVHAVFRKPGSTHIWWKVGAASGEELSIPCNVQIRFFSSKKCLPLSAGVAIFDRNEDIPAQVEELVVHYEHNKKSIIEMANEFEDLCSPRKLVQEVSLSQNVTEVE